MQGSADVDAILEKGPEFLRERLDLEPSETTGGRVSARALLAATKPRYVKSQQVVNTIQEPAISFGSASVSSNHSNGSSNRSSNRSSSRSGNRPARNAHDPGAGGETSPAEDKSAVRRSSSKKRPDSMLLYRQKCDLLKSPAGETSKRNLALRRLLNSLRDKTNKLPEAQERENNTNTYNTTTNNNDTTRPEAQERESVGEGGCGGAGRESAGEGGCGGAGRESYSGDNKAAPGEESDSKETRSVPALLVTQCYSNESWSSTSSPLGGTETGHGARGRPPHHRVAEIQRRERRGVARSRSDISSRYSKNFADFDAFFLYCGLDGDIVESLGKENFSARSDEQLSSRLQSPSTADSDGGFSRGSGTSDDGLQVEELAGAARQGTSVIERNARVIKWLYSCRNASQRGKALRDLD